MNSIYSEFVISVVENILLTLLNLSTISSGVMLESE